MSFLASWFVLSLSIGLTAKILPGFEVKGGVGSLVLVAALVGILSFFLGKLLFGLIVVGTLGLGYLLAFVTRWFVLAVVLKVADALSDSLKIRGFSTALVASLLMSAFGTLGEWIVARLL